MSLDIHTKQQVREIMLAHGFTIKEGQDDLKPYVYEAAESLLQLAFITGRRCQCVPILEVYTPICKHYLPDDGPGNLCKCDHQRNCHGAPQA